MPHTIAQYFLNHRLDHDELRRQIALIAEAGYEGLFAEPRCGLLTPFDSEAWWRAMDVIVRECERHGLQCWIWDEDYFPSGIAGGRVTLENPGLRCKELTLAVVGDEFAIRDFKAILDYHLALGCTFFAMHGLSYSFDGPCKDEVPPSLFFQHTQFPHMRALLDYTHRTAAQLTGGEHVCELAVLYPFTSLACQIVHQVQFPNLPDEEAFHVTAETLLSNQRDFDLIDEVTLREKTDVTGKLKTPEKYRVIVVANMRYIEQATADCLNRLAAAGTRVVVVGSMPRAIGAGPGQLRATWANGSVEHHESLTATLLTSLPYLTAAPRRFELDALRPWSALGYPTFSGAAIYRRTFELRQAGRYVLDLGRVEESAAVKLNDEAITVAAWRPYVVDLGELSAGKHALEIEVRNGPANRDRASGLTSGLLGSVRLLRRSHLATIGQTDHKRKTNAKIDP
ncbi:MAG: hypothetical protein HY360_09575 [Verrucomicrobia bacterium]|nr:hypothetical protein [Verrucomicrobiota bacterium]